LLNVYGFELKSVSCLLTNTAVSSDLHPL